MMQLVAGTAIFIFGCAMIGSTKYTEGRIAVKWVWTQYFLGLALTLVGLIVIITE